MYWTHLIFVLLHGALISWNKISASKPGYLDFDNLPETNFSCDGKVIGGYYADVETGCQMFHVCTIGQKGEITDIKFLCLNGTVFDQETRVCERIDEVDCSKSEDFFGLNLELYGNSASFGIQPENEFECEDCSTDQVDEDDEYEESEETTTYTTSTTTTTTTTTTTPKPATTASTTTGRPYASSNQDALAALLALHNAFSQGSKVKPPPPRVINNAFSPTKPTARPYPTHATARPFSTYPTQATVRPYSTYPTQRPNPNHHNFKSHYNTPDSQSYGSLNLQQRERPYYFTPTTEKSNYHHFHSGDTSFGHSFDVTRPYNFQYFHSKKLPSDKSDKVSVVTSTSTSTSVKTSRGNATEYPTGYDDYQDDIQDSYFDDITKVRRKRELHPNHRYDDNESATTVRYKNHKYDDEEITKPTISDRDEFLQNLLGSIDLEENVRLKMTDFFKKEEEDMNQMTKKGDYITNIGNKIGQVFLQGLNFNSSSDRKSRAEKISEWQQVFDDMKKDIKLNYTFETHINDNDNNTLFRVKREARRIENTRTTIVTSHTADERTQPRRTNIDTEKFHVEPLRRNQARQHSELIPVSESINDDLTTVEYRKSSKKARVQPRSTTSLRAFKFNYETTSALPEAEPKFARASNLNTKEVRDFVHEEIEPGIQHHAVRKTRVKQRKLPPRIHTASIEETDYTGRKAAQSPATPQNLRELTATESVQSTIKSGSEEFTHRESFHPQPIQHQSEDYTSSELVEPQPIQQNSRQVSSRGSFGPQPIQHNSRQISNRGSFGPQPIQENSRQVSSRGSFGPQPIQENSRQVSSRGSFGPQPIQQNSRQFTSRESAEPIQHNSRKFASRGTAKPQTVQAHGRQHTRPSSVEKSINAQEERAHTVQVRKRIKQTQTSTAPIPTSSYPPSSISYDYVDQNPFTPMQLGSLSRESFSKDAENISPKLSETPALPRKANERRRGGRPPKARSEIATTSTTPIPRVPLTPDPSFDCEGKVKGGFYADLYNDCKAFFICSQGEINGPLLKTHFPCGDKTKFNQRSRTCQAEDLVQCSVSDRYFHLNNDFLVPVSEDELKGTFEPMKER